MDALVVSNHRPHIDYVPALDELAEALRARGVKVEPRLIAAVILEIAREKLSKDGPGQLADWVQQLAIDMLQ